MDIKQLLIGLNNIILFPCNKCLSGCGRKKPKFRMKNEDTCFACDPDRKPICTRARIAL